MKAKSDSVIGDVMHTRCVGFIENNVNLMNKRAVLKTINLLHYESYELLFVLLLITAIDAMLYIRDVTVQASLLSHDIVYPAVCMAAEAAAE